MGSKAIVSRISKKEIHGSQMDYQKKIKKKYWRKQHLRKGTVLVFVFTGKWYKTKNIFFRIYSLDRSKQKYWDTLYVTFNSRL